MVVVNSAVRLNGLAGLLITKLDVLSGIPKLQIGVSYNCRDSRVDYIPAQLDALEACDPIFEEFPGWDEDIGNVRRWDDLPRNTRKYLKAIEEISGVPVDIISVGPSRDATIVLADPFAK
jgi:adenylosuccinate synthase